MSDNVVKFRRIEKKPEKKPEKNGRKVPVVPSWLAWLALVLVACGATALQYFRRLGGL